MEYHIIKCRKGFVITKQEIIIKAESLEEAVLLANDDDYYGEQLVDYYPENIEWEELKEEWLEDNKGEIIY